jgi:hypothetical protein
MQKTSGRLPSLLDAFGSQRTLFFFAVPRLSVNSDAMSKQYAVHRGS